ncbi:MAG: hypothetical protein LAT68_03845 [Cyclobacteriaceae bacterium]|nr:hypothetical protein [Cyclobacteriaceae bacterium]MCH8515442.1 hypothetical protein [Cyclobacteriaceae bacterium]
MGKTLKRKNLKNRQRAIAKKDAIKRLIFVPEIKSVDVEAIKKEFEAKK